MLIFFSFFLRREEFGYLIDSLLLTDCQIRLELFYALKLENRVHCMFTGTFSVAVSLEFFFTS